MARRRRDPSPERAARTNASGDGRAGRQAGLDRAELARELISDMQRSRLLAATSQVAGERGAANTTVAHVVERAGVSRRTFYELFDDCEDCITAALEQALAHARERVLAAYRGEARWRERMRAALAELLLFLDEEPVRGRLLIVESLCAGKHAQARRAQVLTHVIRAVNDGRGEARAAEQITALTAEGVVGGVLSILHGRLQAGDTGRLTALMNPLMSTIVLPYLGIGAARRELERPPLRARDGARGASDADGTPADTLRETGMRVTYRTMHVLATIADHPGSSNRAIADLAQMRDQGQISKLLSRMKRLGLIENTTDGAARGLANAWRLTERGRQVHNIFVDRG